MHDNKLLKESYSEKGDCWTNINQMFCMESYDIFAKIINVFCKENYGDTHKLFWTTNSHVRTLLQEVLLCVFCYYPGGLTVSNRKILTRRPISGVVSFGLLGRGADRVLFFSNLTLFFFVGVVRTILSSA